MPLMKFRYRRDFMAGPLSVTTTTPAAFRDDLDLGQNALDILQIRLAAPVQADATMPALEQRTVEMLFQNLDAVRNGRR